MMIQRKAPHQLFVDPGKGQGKIDVHCFHGGSLLSTDHKTDNSFHAPATKIPSLCFFFSFLFSLRLTFWIAVQSTSLNAYCHIPQISIHLTSLVPNQCHFQCPFATAFSDFFWRPPQPLQIYNLPLIFLILWSIINILSCFNLILEHCPKSFDAPPLWKVSF